MPTFQSSTHWGMAALALVMVASCGGGSDDGGSGGPISFDGFPAQASSAICSAIVPCCAAAGFPVTQSACRARFTDQLTAEYAAADSSKYTYDPEAAGACLSSIRQGGTCDIEDSFGLGDESCDRIFAGTQAPGDSCVSGIECAQPEGGDADCDEVMDEMVCVQEVRVGTGSSCYWTCTEEGTVTTCSGGGSQDNPHVEERCFTNDGNYCGDGTCTALSDIGGPCNGSEGCKDGAYCNADVCEATIPEGGECTSRGCESGTYCKEGMCVKELPVGSPCVLFDDECAGGRCNDGVCEEDSDGGSVGIGIVCALLF